MRLVKMMNHSALNGHAEFVEAPRTVQSLLDAHHLFDGSD